MAWTTAGLSSLAGCESAEVARTRPAALLVEQRGGHLGPVRVVGAHEQHLRHLSHHGRPFLVSRPARLGGSR